MGWQNIKRLIERAGVEDGPIDLGANGFKADTIKESTASAGISVTNATNFASTVKVTGALNCVSTITVNGAASFVGNVAVAAGKVVTLADNANIAVNNTTGTVIATNNAQKLGFWGATPVVQQAALTNVANDANSNINAVIQRVNAISTSLHNVGIIA